MAVEKVGSGPNVQQVRAQEARDAKAQAKSEDDRRRVQAENQQAAQRAQTATRGRSVDVAG